MAPISTNKTGHINSVTSLAMVSTFLKHFLKSSYLELAKLFNLIHPEIHANFPKWVLSLWLLFYLTDWQKQKYLLPLRTGKDVWPW